MGKIGINISSLRGHKPEETLSIVEALARLGYEGVEFIRYTAPPARELRHLLDDLGIRASGNHVAYEGLIGDLNRVLEYNLEIGSPYIVCPRLPEEMRNEGGCRRAAEALYRVGEACRKNGMTLMYQHHDWELFDHHGSCGLDLMAELIPEDLLLFQMETYWLESCGIEALGFIKKYQNRCRSIHIADKGHKAKPDYCELGRGIVPLKAIVETCQQFDMEWYNIQQEQYTQEMFVSLDHNRRYLKELLGE